MCVRPPTACVAHDEIARPRLFVRPRWVAGAPLTIEPVDKGEAFLMVATNAFNYETLGEIAFDLVRDMVRSCDCYALTYSDLDEVIAAIDTLGGIADG